MQNHLRESGQHEGESERGADSEKAISSSSSTLPPHSRSSELPPDQGSASAASEAPPDSANLPRPHERRNFWLLIVYQIVLRAGWIFKTESVVMPHAADALDPTGWARSWLPLLNRVGHSIPPVLAARRIKNLRKKQSAFMATTASMTLCFLGLTSLWLIPGLAGHPLSAVVFLALYAVFFMAIGVNQLAYNTIQGKLIRPTWRGRLLMIADFVGATTAVVCAIFLLRQWLHDEYADYAAIFGFTTALFAAASLMTWFLREQPDDYHERYRGVRHIFASAWKTLVRDANFRRLALVAALFSTSLILFPHYQAIARERLGLGTTWLVWWVVAQNAGTALFSLLMGPIADWRGNRLVLRIVTFFIAAGPLTAMLFVWWPEVGRPAFPLVFALVGLTPVAQKSFNNYTLEIATPENHPRYLSTLSLSMAAPILASPLIGLAINAVGFEAVYLTVTALLLLGWLLSFALTEPRAGGRPIVLAEDSITE